MIKDRRCNEIRPDSIAVAGILLTFGWYASPYNPIDTLFTQTLARLGLETFWSVLFVVAGFLKMTSAIWCCSCPLWISFSANWLTAMACLWTGFMFWKMGPITPTTAACWVIGACAVLALYRNARQKQRLRVSYGPGTESTSN